MVGKKFQLKSLADIFCKSPFQLLFVFALFQHHPIYKFLYNWLDQLLFHSVASSQPSSERQYMFRVIIYIPSNEADFMYTARH